jgi:signal transduction histidine kinase
MALDAVLTQTEITATGTFRTGATRVCSIILTAAAAAVTAIIRDNGAGGTVRATLAAPIGISAIWTSDPGIAFGTDVHVTLSGAGVVCDIGWKPLN